MSRLNFRAWMDRKLTHEGAPAALHLTVEEQLRRSVLSCLLWEKEFYEDGVSIADRIVALAEQAPPARLAALAIEARSKFNLRQVPLLLIAVLAKTGAGTRLVSDTIESTVRRADELSEFLAIYWRNGKTPLSAQVKKGLAASFKKFDAYQLAKYDRENIIRLRDVLFLSHAKPANDDQVDLWKRLVDNELTSPDTWEVALSGGADKKETFERLIRERKLGYLALLRNLRNMVSAGCDLELVREAILARKGADRVLPFRYIAAARACPQLEPALDEALCASIAAMTPFSGLTVVLVDVSSSMDARLSARSDLTRKDAAAALAAILPGHIRMFSFADHVIEIPPRRGMAGVDAIRRSQNGGTRLFDAIDTVNREVVYDRLIVITDEQAFPANADLLRGREQSARRTCPSPNGVGYMINVASNRNGVGYGAWCHIDGFSEQVLRFIAEHEAAVLPQ
jgi:60 kDa SS-A/Ro ribonucleoprotein